MKRLVFVVISQAHAKMCLTLNHCSYRIAGDKIEFIRLETQVVTLHAIAVQISTKRSVPQIQVDDNTPPTTWICLQFTA